MLDQEKLERQQKEFNKRKKKQAKKNWYDIVLNVSDHTGIDHYEKPAFHRTKRHIRVGKMLNGK